MNIPFRPSTSIKMLRKHRVLVVDDDAQVLNELRQILIKLDCEFVLCASPSEAIGRASAQKFELAIFEENLDEMSGYQLVEYFDEVSPNAEIIMMTEDNLSSPPNESLSRPYERLKKPFGSSTEIRNLIRHALERHSLRERNDFLERQVAMSEKFEDLIGPFSYFWNYGP